MNVKSAQAIKKKYGCWKRREEDWPTSI